ncbi:hypothetical protein PYW07_008772 [Mythimna separata]|uniref:Reverse transcriptase domain-containing protein n=1 Tax=Mythimna separata TaxID=271217 RepID=A0AAD7YEF1_MYTSE|nr:hypothetical protein PYW07_008772 [Mythimna separata]
MIDVNEIINTLDTFGSHESFICPPDKCHQILGNPNKTINVLHLNIRSISKNFNSVLVLLASLKISCDVIIFSECWLNKNINIPILPGYSVYSSTISLNQNDGVVVYVRSDLEHVITEPEFDDANCLIFKLADIVIIAIYRPPSFRKIDNFLSSLNTVLSSVSSYKNVFLVGDMNINIIPTNNDATYNDYMNLTASHGLLPAYTSPTRDKSCLDHVMTRAEKFVLSFIMDSHITDHVPVLVCIQNKTKRKITKSVSKVDLVKVVSEIAKTDFSAILSSRNANWAAESLIDTIASILHNNTLTIRIPSRLKIIKPWITPGLLKCIRNRDNMHKEHKKAPDNYILKITYLRYRNFCNKLLYRLKNNYEKIEFEKAKNNPKKTWQVIKNVINKQVSTSPPLELLSAPGLDCKSSLNLINSFFANIGKDLATKHTNACTKHESYVKDGSQVNTMVLLSPDCAEIENVIMGLRSDSAPGWDGIGARLLKLSRQTLVPLVTHICCLCISEGIFPRVLKRAVIHPIHKGGDRGSVNNYRPISVLPALSKVLEKVLNNRLVSYLEKNNILSKNQFGFRRGKSCEDAFAALIDDVVETLDKKSKCLGLFLDLSKAFDTVSVPILLKKLEQIGVRGPALAVFASYLSERTQCIKIGTYVSDECGLAYGVPQGSILGPTLFLVYVNSLCDLALPNCSIYTYADDTALLVHAESWEEARERAEFVLSIVMSWLTANSLTLNVEKTNFITFSLTSSSQPDNSFAVKAHTCDTQNSSHCSCLPLSRTNSVKYLGILIDDLITWNAQIKVLAGRVRKLITVFKNLRYSADADILRMVYFSLCQSILSFGITVWGGAPKTSMLQLERAQRAVLKVMTFKHYRHSTAQLYKECQVLTVRQLFVLNCTLRKHMLLQLDFDRLTKRRTTNVCSIVRHRTKLAKRHFRILGSRIYNFVNKKCSIYRLNKFECKARVSKWITTLSYDEVECILNT